jgi:hypothetical protein
MGQSASEMRSPDHPAASSPAANDPAVIEAEIEQTRTEMSGTIDAIQQRLNPDTLAEQAKDAAREAVEEAKEAVRGALLEAKESVREATIGRVETMVRNVSDSAYETRDGIMDTVRHNPIPAALVGIGLGWLWMNRRNASPRRMNGYYANDAYRYGRYEPGTYSQGGYAPVPSHDGGNRVTQMAGRAQQAVGNMTDQVGETAGNLASTVGETAGNLASTVGETAGTVAGQVGQAAGNLASTVGETASNLAATTQETAGNLVSGAQYQAQRAEDRLGRALQDNPLAVGAVALALGAAVGLALPLTERENQLMGEARDTLVERAQEFAQDTMDKVQHVATEAQQTVQQEARSQGLTS